MGLIQRNLPLRNPNALTQTVISLISQGMLPPGTRLPTVRAMAAAVGMSPSGVSQAWSALAARKAVETRRRAGTVVVGLPEAPSAERYLNLLHTTYDAPLDLGSLRGDALGQPSLADAFRAAAGHAAVNLPYPEPMCPELISVLEPLWPSRPQAWLALHGVPDLIELFCSIYVRRGDHVLVESPTYPRVLDVVESLGGIPEPVPWREDGLDLSALAKAMATSPVAMIAQPSVAAPGGRSYSQAWLSEAAPVLKRGSFPILEISLLPQFGVPALTLATQLPDRVVRGEAMVFWCGQDLRVCPCSGPAAVLDRMWRQLSYSSRLVSRVNQLALAHIRADETAQAQTGAMTRAAEDRAAALRASLTAVGMTYQASVGPGIWLDVRNETDFLARLRADGIAAAPGSAAFPKDPAPADALKHAFLCSAPIAVPDAPDIARRLARANGESR